MSCAEFLIACLALLLFVEVNMEVIRSLKYTNTKYSYYSCAVKTNTFIKPSALPTTVPPEVVTERFV